jgi:hypothetical protein
LVWVVASADIDDRPELNGLADEHRREWIGASIPTSAVDDAPVI